MGFLTRPAMRTASMNAITQRTPAPTAQRSRRSGSEERKGAMNAPLRQTANKRKYRSPCIVRPRSIWAAPGIRESATIRIRNGGDYSKKAFAIKHQPPGAPEGGGCRRGIGKVARGRLPRFAASGFRFRSLWFSGRSVRGRALKGCSVYGPGNAALTRVWVVSYDGGNVEGAETP